MNLLAFDTSTETLSVALRVDAGPLLELTGEGGARASVTLIPAVQDLLARGGIAPADLQAIVFGRGPGSFTGLRTACAVAQGLAFGAGVPVLGLDTLLAVAEEAQGRCGAQQVVAVLDARMDQVYWAAYRRQGATWETEHPPALAAPEEVVVPAGWTLAGNALELHAARLPGADRRIAALPTASALLRLAPPALAAGQAQPAAGALPLYIRDKVAQTTEERALQRARKEAGHPP